LHDISTGFSLGLSTLRDANRGETKGETNMSVINFDIDQLANLGAAIISGPANDRAIRQAAEAVHACHVANMNAYNETYGEAHECIDIEGMTRAIRRRVVRADHRAAVGTATSLRYNMLPNNAGVEPSVSALHAVITILSSLLRRTEAR
jgi:hypothetical protein